MLDAVLDHDLRAVSQLAPSDLLRFRYEKFRFMGQFF
jgi:acetyl-CoA carboxylase alpha subunit